MTFADKKRYFNICDPLQYIEADNDKFVDLDEMKVRGRDWSQELASDIEMSDKPIYKLFTGHRGSGKTTELKKVQRRLEKTDGANLLVVYVNADEYIDLSSEIDVPDILSVVVHSTIKTVAEYLGENVESALKDGYFKRLWNWLNTTDVDFSKAEFGVKDSAKLVFEMKTRPTLRQKIRQTVASNFSVFVERIREELIAQQNKALAQKSGIIVIFDQLERLRGLSHNWHEVLQSAERVFGGDGQYVKLPVHVIYTFPPALATRINHYKFLPVIKIKTRENEPNEEGIKAMRLMALQRIPESGMAELLGDDWSDRLNEIIAYTGGYPRDLMLMLRAALGASSFPIDKESFENIFGDFLNEFKQLATREDMEWLAKVAKNKELAYDNKDHSASVDKMLSVHAVLRYLNGDEWHDVHPAVAKILQREGL